MKKNIRKKLILISILSILILSLLFLFLKDNTLTIGTGSEKGIYYPTGLAISEIINKYSNYQSIAIPSKGSVYNVKEILQDNFTFGIVQSDVQHDAYTLGKTNLRALLSLHPETITLVASAQSNIKSVTDLKGKKVNLGNDGSGHLQNAKTVLKIFDLTEKDLSPSYLNIMDSITALKNGEIDAYFYTIGHPDKTTYIATSSKIKTNLIPISGPKIETYIKDHPYYTINIIKKEFYPTAPIKLILLLLA
mgnify:FL=1